MPDVTPVALSNDDLLALLQTGAPAPAAPAVDGLQIRQAGQQDLWALLELYPHLGDNPLPQDENDPALALLWTKY